MSFHGKSLGHHAGKDQGVAAYVLVALTEARAAFDLQTKCGGALSSDVWEAAVEVPSVEVFSKGYWAGWEPVLSFRVDPSGLFHPRCQWEAEAAEETDALAPSPTCLHGNLACSQPWPQPGPGWVLAHCLGSRWIT